MFVVNLNKVALHVGLWDRGSGSWSQKVIVLERRTIGKDREAMRIGSAKKCSARVFSFLSRLISMSRDGRKEQNRANGAAFLVLILSFLQSTSTTLP